MYLCHHIVPVDFCWSRHDAFVLGTQGVLGTISGQSARREGRAGVQLAFTYMGVSWNGVPKWIVNGQSY